MKKNIILLFSLFSVIMIPGFCSIILSSSSLRDGIVIGIIMFLLASVLTFKIKQLLILKRQNVQLSILVVLAIIIHFAVSLLNNYDVDYFRFIMSFILLIFFLMTSMLFAKFLKLLQQKGRPACFDNSLKKLFLLLIGIGAVAAFVFDQGFFRRGNMLFFREPSHYSLTLLPFLTYFIYKSHQKLIFLLASFGLAYFLKSATLVVGVVFVVSLLTMKNYKHSLFFLTILFLTVFLCYSDIIDIKYFIERMRLSSDSHNISALVYLSGWESVLSSLIDTSGIGIGFQQLGVIVFRTSARIKLEGYGLGDLCLWDGSFLAAKVICEFGVLGIFAIIIYLRLAFMLIYNLSKSVPKSDEDVFFSIVFIMFSVELFIRGTGYFSPTVFMFLSSVFWINSGSSSILEKEGRSVSLYCELGSCWDGLNDGPETLKRGKGFSIKKGPVASYQKSQI